MLFAGKPLHNETQRHIRRLSSRVDAHIEALDDLIRTLHYRGLWGKLHFLNVAGANSVDSLLDITSNERDSSLVGSPAHVAYQGFTTVSTTAVIDTGYTIQSADNNDFALGVYVRNLIPTAAANAIGMRSSASPYTLMAVSTTRPSTSYVWAKLQKTYAPSGVVFPSQKGFVAASRRDASNVQIIANGTTYNKVFSSTLLPTTNETLHVGCLNDGGSLTSAAPNEYACWFASVGLTATELTNLRSAIRNYFTRLGTAVV